MGEVDAVVSSCGEDRRQLVCRDDRRAEPDGYSDAIGRSAVHGDHAITMPKLQLRVERLGPVQQHGLTIGQLASKFFGELPLVMITRSTDTSSSTPRRLPTKS